MQSSITLSESITRAVASQYNAFPYPNYPLLAKPLWQDAYMASSLFVGKLLEATQGQVPSILTSPLKQKRVLLAGCGDTQPYVLRKLEPRAIHLSCVDLSGSNLRRAKARIFPWASNMSFFEEDLLTFAKRHEQNFDHIDSFGVLHHLADCAQTFNALASSLKSNGTMRIMVYNSTARKWIHHIQSIFRLMDLSPSSASDLNDARAFLSLLMHQMPQYADKLRSMGRQTIENKARLVDTFFHAREIRKDIPEWMQFFRTSGLVPFALWDRYGELDDLPNPLWVLPSDQQLEDKALRGKFRGNLEVYLYKPGPSLLSTPQKYDLSIKHWLLKKSPPLWQNFPEICDLNFVQRSQIWFHFCKSIGNGSIFEPDSSVSEKLLQRLARLGVFSSADLARLWRERLQKPICRSSDIAESKPVCIDIPVAVQQFIAEILLQKRVMQPRRMKLIEERLRRAAEGISL